MSSMYEIESSCAECEKDNCSFSTKKITAHSKKHRIQDCPDCKCITIISGCMGC